MPILADYTVDFEFRMTYRSGVRHIYIRPILEFGPIEHFIEDRDYLDIIKRIIDSSCDCFILDEYNCYQINCDLNIIWRGDLINDYKYIKPTYRYPGNLLEESD